MTEQELRSFWQSCDAQCGTMSAANFDELAERPFLPFIGAGMSASFGYPAWTDFLRQEIRLYAPEAKRAELQKLLKEKQFLPLADALNQCTNSSIVSMIRDTFHPSRMRSIEETESNYLKLLHKRGVCSYVTTNYDGVIEAHDSGAQVILPTTCRTIQALKDLDRRGQPFLLKLHGTYNDPGSVVLTKKQYQMHYPQDLEAPNPAALHYLWTTKVLLFLGCSLEKDYMVKQMFHLAGNSPEICHYAIVEWPKAHRRQAAKRRELMELHIRPIWYPQGDHSCVCTILSMLAEGKGEPKPAKRLDPGGAAPKSSARLKPASWGDILSAKDFLGRESKKQELAEKLRTSDLVFLSGVGGIGKSELAAQYAREQAEAGKTVVRMFYHPGEPKAEDPVEASGLRKLLLNLTILDDPEFAGLPPEDGAARIKYYQGKLHRLKQLCNPNTLLIIDNFDVDRDDGLGELQELGAKVILTTRQDFHSYFAQVDLEPLDEEEAFRLFCRHAKLGSHDREEEARQLIRQVERHTTAIILLAAQKEADGFTTGQLLERLTQGLRQAGESSVRLRKDGKLLDGENAFRLLCAVLNAAELPQEERKLLANLSLLGPQGIAPGNLCQWCGLPNRDRLNRLVKLHWVEKEEDRVFLSPVIGQVAFETAGASFAVCGLFLEAWSWWYKGLSREEQYLWRETLQTVGTNVLLLMENEEDQELAERTAFVLHGLGLRCYEQALRPQAEKLYRESLELRRKLSASNPSVYEPDVAMTCNSLANLLSDSTEGREEAEELYRESLELNRKLSASNPSMYEPYVAGTCNNLAVLLKASPEGRAEAEKLYREALELYRKLSASNPSVYEPDVAMTCNNLANLLKASTEGREEAEELYRESLELYRKLTAVNPSVYKPDAATTCNNLANLLSASAEGRAEAEELYRESLELYRKLTAVNPSVYEPYVAMTCNNLANLLKASTEGPAEAEELYRESLELYRKLSATNPSVYEPYVAGTCNNLANLLSASPEGREEAEALYQEALALRRKQVRIAPEVYGPNLARVCRNLGRFLQSQGRTEEAEALFQEAKGE